MNSLLRKGQTSVRLPNLYTRTPTFRGLPLSQEAAGVTLGHADAGV